MFPDAPAAAIPVLIVTVPLLTPEPLWAVSMTMFPLCDCLLEPLVI